jgi:hypothetical protein
MLTSDKKEICLDIRKRAGANTVSREHGEIIRKIIEQSLEIKDKITIDFSNLSMASPSFIDEAFAKLFLTYSFENLKQRLLFVNMTEFDRALLNNLIRARIREHALLVNTKYN